MWSKKHFCSLSSQHPSLLLSPHIPAGMAVLPSMPLAASAPALHPLSEHNHGTAKVHISTGYHAWKTILCYVTERCQIINFLNGCWPQFGPSLWLRAPQPHLGLLNKGWLPWVCPPCCSQCSAQGSMCYSVPQLEGVMSWLCCHRTCIYTQRRACTGRLMGMGYEHAGTIC